jgi:hypothetical protein
MSRLRSLILLQRWAGRPGKLILISLSTFMFSFLFQLVWTVPGHAQHLPDQCLDPLPTPTPTPPSHRVVQLVNCTYVTLLGAANAAGQSDQELVSVLPREGTWVMGPLGSGRNVLTIDIPSPQWEDTQKGGSSGPRFWARTGCKYEIQSDRAQCETGDCGGKYDCSEAKLVGQPPVTASEWIFYQPFPNNQFQDHLDITVVDGASLNMDIQQVGGSATDPVNPGSAFWLAENYPLTKHGQDLRNQCLDSFALKRSELMGVPHSKGWPSLGYVIMDDNGQPKGGDSTVGCFSNCGRYEFPTNPGFDCDPNVNPLCKFWKVFCTVQRPPPSPPVYGGKCNTDADCATAQLSACWDLHDPKSPLNKTCQPRAFIKNQTCSPDVCTFAYGFINPKTGRPDFSTQPPAGNCTDVTNDPNACIGDDTVHQVMPKGLTWPNDPEVFGGDPPLYRVIFAPGNTLVPITDSTAGFPLCSTLSEVQYEYSKWVQLCANDINSGAVFAVAHLMTAIPPVPANWSCKLLDADSGATGPICRWKQGPVFIPAPSPPRPH